MSLKCSASRRISKMLTANGSSTGPKRSKPFVNNLSPQRMTKEALDYLTQADKRLGRLIQQVGPCRLKLKKHRSPFQALVESVVYQQLNGTAAATILGRVKALYPGRGSRPRKTCLILPMSACVAPAFPAPRLRQ